jgi:uncharacterized membrane protein YhaH (DUF805 family)
MGLVGLFFRISGRIPRSKFWLAHIGIFVGCIVGAMVSAPGIYAQAKAAKAAGEAADASAILLPSMSLTVFVLLLGYMSFCVSAKRLHDRDKSAWWILGFEIPAILLLLGPGVLPHVVILVLKVASAIGSLWFLIELGFCRGTDGPNRFDHHGSSLQPESGPSWADKIQFPGEQTSNTAAPRIPVAKPPTAAAVQPARSMPRGPAKPAGFGRRGLKPA